MNDGEENQNDHNDVWQDGGVIADLGKPEFAALLYDVHAAAGSDRRSSAIPPTARIRRIMAMMTA